MINVRQKEAQAFRISQQILKSTKKGEPGHTGLKSRITAELQFLNHAQYNERITTTRGEPS